MTRVIALSVLLLALAARLSFSQVVDDFSDGDFSSNPTWAGLDSLWTVVAFGPDSAVRLDGTAASDTAYLSTANEVAYGTWRITVRYEGGRLSNFNQIRIFLVSSSQDLTAPLEGYHVQLGTNDRNVRLYRNSASVGDGRVLLASSASDWLGMDEATIELEITRSTSDEWTVKTDGQLALTFNEPTGDAVAASSYFGFWVKHSATRNQHYYFDDVDASDTLPPDTTAPSILSATYAEASNSIEIQFSESLDPASVTPAAFDIDNAIGAPDGAQLEDPTVFSPKSLVRLSYDVTIPGGDYLLTASGIADVSGNTATTLSAALSVVSDTEPPGIQQVVVLDPRHLQVDFTESVDSDSACQPQNYAVEQSTADVINVVCLDDGPDSVQLELDQPLAAGSYTLTVVDVADLNGNAIVSDSYNFDVATAGDIPAAGDVVINEISYNPAEPNLEYFELLNRSSKSFDLSAFDFSDNRLIRNAVSESPAMLAPGDYAVLVRDSDLFFAAFPTVSYFTPPVWPALNNTGDAVILYFGTQTVDSVAFLPSWGGTGVSLERRDPAGPSAAAINWGSSTDSAGGTPGSQNSIYGPDSSGPTVLFAEVIRAGIIKLYFNEPIAVESAVPSNFQLGDVNPEHVSLAGDATTVELELTVPTSEAIAVRNIADLTGNVASPASVSVAQLAEPGQLRITEILFDPRADDSDGLPDQTEFFEIFNTSTRLLSVSNVWWSDRPNEDNVADTLRPDANGVGIAPGHFGIVFAQPISISPDDLYSESEIVAAFPHDYRSDATVLLPLRGSTLGLLNAGDLIRLHRADGLILDEVAYDPSWHQPNLRDTKGTSLERIDPDGPSDRPNNWSSSVAPNGATPGLVNSVNLAYNNQEGESRIAASPSPFSPDGDGIDDFTAISYNLDAALSTVRVRIFDSRGRLVRELEPGILATSTGTVVWDGRDDDSNDLRIGIYVVLLDAIDSTGGTTESYKTVVVLARPLD